MLRGPSLSPIQHYAASVLDIVDYIYRIKSEDRQVRLALLTHTGPEALTDLFDEYKEVITDDNAEIDDGVDDSGMEVSTVYDFSHAETSLSQAEVEREIAEMLAQASAGQATFETPTYGEWI